MPEVKSKAKLTLFFVAGGAYLVDRSGRRYFAPFTSENYACGCGKIFDAGESFKEYGYRKDPGGWVLGEKWFCADCVEVVRWDALLAAYDGMVEIAEAYGVKLGGSGYLRPEELPDQNLSRFIDKSGKLRCHVAYGCDQRDGAGSYCDDRKCNSRMIHIDLLNKKQAGDGE